MPNSRVSENRGLRSWKILTLVLVAILMFVWKAQAMSPQDAELLADAQDAAENEWHAVEHRFLEERRAVDPVEFAPMTEARDLKEPSICQTSECSVTISD